VDIGGSGIETVAHLKENGRITIMMCAFEGPPKIVRFYGRGTAIEPHDVRYEELLSCFLPLPAARSIILIDVRHVVESCGYGVPFYEFQRNRNSLEAWYGKRSKVAAIDYWRENNCQSLDGLKGLDVDLME
jgi:hypothetical protein